MRKYINTLDQTRLARALNRELVPLDGNGRFATALLTTYFAATDHLIICNAGLPWPLWFHAATGSWELLGPDTPQQVLRRVLAMVAEYHGRRPAEDDQTLPVLHHNAADPPKQTLGEKMHVMARMLGLFTG